MRNKPTPYPSLTIMELPSGGFVVSTLSAEYGGHKNLFAASTIDEAQTYVKDAWMNADDTGFDPEY